MMRNTEFGKWTWLVLLITALSITGCDGDGDTPQPETSETPAYEPPAYQPPVDAGTSGTAEWGQYHIKYSINGAVLGKPPALNSPFGYDIYSYTGRLAGSVLAINGAGWVEQPSGANDDYNYTFSASVTAGAYTTNFTHTAPKGEILNQGFNLMVPITDTANAGSFSMRVDYANSQYGPRGVVVNGTLEGRADR